MKPLMRCTKQAGILVPYETRAEKVRISLLP